MNPGVTSIEEQPAAPEFQGSVAGRLFRASAVIAVGNVAGRLIAVVISIVSARLLLEQEFGALGAIQGTLSMFGITATLSLGMAATRYVALYRVTDPARARSLSHSVLAIGLVTSLLTALALVAAAPWLAASTLRSPGLVTPLRLAALQLLFVSLYGLIGGILTGVERFAASSAANILQNVCILLGSVLMIPAFRLNGAILAQALGCALSVLVGAWMVRDYLRGLRPGELARNLRRDARMLFSFCFPLVLGGLMIIPASWAAMTLIARQPNGFQELAFFTAADRFRMIVLFLAGFTVTALLPILSGEQAAKEGSLRSCRSLELGISANTLLVLPVATAFAFAGPQIMAAFGKSYSLNWAVLLPVIAWATAGAIGSLIGTALLAAGKQWFLFSQQAVYGIGLVALTLALRRFGGAGLAFAHLAMVLVLVAGSVPVLRRMKDVNSRIAATLAGSVAGILLVCILAWFCPSGWRLSLSGPLTLAVAAICFFALFSRHERTRLWQLVPLQRKKLARRFFS